LYERYRWDEPWDGPNNKALLESIPPVYRDPLYPATKDTFTHYAAITGPGTAFPLEPRKPLDSSGQMSPGSTEAHTSLSDMRDGTSNVIVVGSVSPDRRIPWMKPEDVAWSDDFPGPGKPGGFAAAYKIGERAAGVFLHADGSAGAIRDDIAVADWHNLLQIADGHPIGEIPAYPSRSRKIPRPEAMTMLEIPLRQPGAG
jgi:hypothetical protein